MKEKEQRRIDPITYRPERMVLIVPLRDWLRFYSRYGVFHQGMRVARGAIALGVYTPTQNCRTGGQQCDNREAIVP